MLRTVEWRPFAPERQNDRHVLVPIPEQHQDQRCEVRGERDGYREHDLFLLLHEKGTGRISEDAGSRYTRARPPSQWNVNSGRLNIGNEVGSLTHPGTDSSWHDMGSKVTHEEEAKREILRRAEKKKYSSVCLPSRFVPFREIYETG